MSNLLSKSVLETKYDPEALYAQKEEILATQSQEEAEAWLTNPFTRALLLAMEGDIAGIFLAWSSGAYADAGSVDATAQLDAKARGMLDALDSITEFIRQIDRERSEAVDEEVEGYGNYG